MSLSLQALPELASFIFLASVKATVLVALVLLIQRMAGSYLSAGARYLLWVTVVISLVTPIGFDTALPAGLMPSAPATLPTASRVAESDTTFVAEARDTAISVPARNEFAAFADVSTETVATDATPLAWLSLLPYLWLAGVITVCGAIAVSGYRFSRLVRRAVNAPQDLQAFLQACMRHTACKVSVTVLQSTEVQVPMIAGLYRPVLLLPTGMEQQVSREQLRHVFIHELMHLQRGDIVSNWIVALVQALHWFNPVVWFAFFRMRQDRELACDAATLKHLAPADRAAYGHTLLQLNATLPQTPVPALALGILDSPSDLQRRIFMLVQSSRYKKLQSFIATVLFIPLAAVAFSQPAPRAPEPVVAAEQLAALAEPAHVIAEPMRTVAEPATAVIEPAPFAAPVPVAPVAAQASPVEPSQPAAQEARTLEPVVANTVLLAQLAATPVADPFAAYASRTAVAATTAAQELLAEPAADLSAKVQQLAELINTAKAKGIPFVEELEQAATECAARGDGIRATLSAPCTKTRRALRRGQIFYFGYQCFLLGTRNDELAKLYREAAPAESGADGTANALRENAENLATFCSKDTYATQYPAFASLFADAESLEYFKPDERVLSYSGISNQIFLDRSFTYYEIGQGYGGGMEGSGAYGGPASAAAPAAESPAPAPAPQ